MPGLALPPVTRSFADRASQNSGLALNAYTSQQPSRTTKQEYPDPTLGGGIGAAAGGAAAGFAAGGTAPGAAVGGFLGFAAYMLG
jgi:hypothetical protein